MRSAFPTGWDFALKVTPNLCFVRKSSALVGLIKFYFGEIVPQILIPRLPGSPCYCRQGSGSDSKVHYQLFLRKCQVDTKAKLEGFLLGKSETICGSKHIMITMGLFIKNGSLSHINKFIDKYILNKRKVKTLH